MSMDSQHQNQLNIQDQLNTIMQTLTLLDNKTTRILTRLCELDTKIKRIEEQIAWWSK